MRLSSFLLIAFFSLSAFGMGDEYHDYHENATVAVESVHARGTVKSIAENHESIRIFHEPIAKLKWPAMNMQFEVMDHDLTHSLNVGDTIEFDFIQKEGKNIIVKIMK